MNPASQNTGHQHAPLRVAATRSLTARYVFPVDQPPLPNGILVIADDKIAAVEPHGTRTADIDLGNVAIIPGLVNAHTHLDLTGMRGKCPPTPDFTQWLRGVIAHRRGQTAEQIQEDIKAGVEQSTVSGTTLVGDIAANGSSWDALANANFRAVVFRELLGLAGPIVMEEWRKLLIWKRDRSDTPTCRLALSPHAPYSASIGLIRTAAWNGYSIAIHLAETAAEVELIA